MAFDITPTEPSVTPRVTVVFAGLFVLQPGAANNTCEIGVNKFDSGRHLFQVKLLIKKTNRPPVLLSLLNGPLFSDFEIRLRPDAGPEPQPDFKAFARAGFDRTPANSNLLDHQWAVNLRSKHPNARLNEGGRPVVSLKTGVLYTPNLTPVGLNPRLTRPNTPDDPLLQIATHLAVSIEPPANNKVVFSGLDSGALFDLRLPRDRDRLDNQDAFYTLFFINEPPALLSEPHDEFALYYRIFEDATNPGNTIPAPQRFRLQFNPGASTDEIPCNPIFFNP